MNHPAQIDTASNPRQRSFAARVWLMLAVGAGAIIAAFLLRYYPSIIRRALTDLLGAEGRAVLEHALAALGLPLVLHMMLMVPPPFWLKCVWLHFHAWLPTPAKRFLALIVRVLFAIRHRLSRQAPGKVTKITAWLARNAGWILSVVYFGGTSLFEFYQAYISVYCGPARGYLQYGQMLADATGALLAVYVAQRFVRKYQT